MRGNPQAASLRVRSGAPARRWATWLKQVREEHRRLRLEQAEVMVRLQAEERRARQSGQHVPQPRPWL